MDVHVARPVERSSMVGKHSYFYLQEVFILQMRRKEAWEACDPLGCRTVWVGSVQLLGVGQGRAVLCNKVTARDQAKSMASGMCGRNLKAALPQLSEMGETAQARRQRGATARVCVGAWRGILPPPLFSLPHFAPKPMGISTATNPALTGEETSPERETILPRVTQGLGGNDVFLLVEGYIWTKGVGDMRKE